MINKISYFYSNNYLFFLLHREIIKKDLKLINKRINEIK